jgi:hypothetical protein
MTDLDEHELTVLFERDAASVEPKRVPLSTIVGRSRRARHRRRSVAAATGVAATVGLGAVVVRVWPEPSGNGEVQAASSAETSDPTDGASVEGPPLRMGLVVDAASVTSAVHREETYGVPAAIQQAGTNMRWINEGGDRKLFVLTGLRPEPTGIVTDTLQLTAGEAIELGDGVQGKLFDYGDNFGPWGEMAQFEIDVAREDVFYRVIGTGLTKDEVIAVARSVQIGDDASWIGGEVPSDLGEGEEYENPTSFSARTVVNYAFADGSTAAVEVYDHPVPMVLDDIERAKANPTAEEYVIDVRGNDAIVRAGVGLPIHTVSWQEGTGELVVVLLTQEAAPGVPDVSVVVDGITPLDEAAFQDLVARFPG